MNGKLYDIFIGLQEDMISSLATNRSIIDHAPTKGDATELRWIKWLKEYLPKRYQVDKAFVIDSNSSLSEQLDLVIYDQQYSPFVFNQEGAKFIPAESVYAVFEVKQELNNQHIKYAGKKIKSVRILERTSARIIHAGGKIDKPKKPFEILGGILTLSSSWDEKFEEKLNESLIDLDVESSLDLGCALQKGSFSVKQDKSDIEISDQEEALIFLFLKLLSRLQSLGTVPALDIDQYAKSLNSYNG